MRFNHAVTVAFEVESNKEDGSDITNIAFRAALLRRIIDLDATNAWQEACQAPFDTYEIDSKPRTSART